MTINSTPLDLAAHMAEKNRPKPVDAEQIVARSFRLEHTAQLPPSVPLVHGETAMKDMFMVSVNPHAGEMYLLIDGHDHRIIGLGLLADEWIKAVLGVAVPDRPRILRELDAAIVAIDTARRIDAPDDGAVTIDEAEASIEGAISSIESALRLARTFRANLASRTEADE